MNDRVCDAKEFACADTRVRDELFNVIPMVKKNTNDRATVTGPKGSRIISSKVAKTPDVPNVLQKPTAKQLVGGASWTGKLPTALLHEFCQKQGWLKPDCNVSNRSGKYVVSSAILSKKNPKNSEIETVSLRPTKEELELLPSKESAVEARNVAATWCLNRIGNKLNFSMQMPPDHRQIWSNLELNRKVTTKDGKGLFLYDADPFKTAKDHAAEVVLWDKEKVKKAELQEKIPRMSTSDGHHISPWKNVPVVDMSKEMRRQIEQGIRSLQLRPLLDHANIKGSAILQDLIKLGFRSTHAAEACEHSDSLENALEFLLLFTPEDDLPHRFLPPTYSTGLTGSSHDTKSLQLDYAARRLHQAGYSMDLCQQTMKAVRHEELAAELLQAALLGQDLPGDASDAVQRDWLDELASLEAIYGNAFRASKNSTEVSLQLPTISGVRLHLRPPATDLYPQALPTFYTSHAHGLPCYIRLAIIKALGEYAKTLAGEPMIFLLLEFLDENVARIIEDPGKLLDLAGSVVGQQESSAKESTRRVKQGLKRKRQVIDWTPNSSKSFAIRARRAEISQQAQHSNKLVARNKLPAAKQAQRIVEILQTDQCLVISGETGSGKSTQVVQYVLDSFIDAGLGEQCSIICTQPRRISALGLADRVGDERSNADEVGYAIRGESKRGPMTKISFVTTGVLLRRLTVNGDAGLDGITHV